MHSYRYTSVIENKKKVIECLPSLGCSLLLHAVIAEGKQI